ncbi:MAG: hypothetical protein AVDCRST_MAG77-867 [uncultured Chloroflexi bacterium]|uniref:Uncharacterized protein n=1 Tax=uncultured Chloroflexota bacterium TaxID=166587 RepID=A0A6J4HLN7_9CHLR|nr:MAG: hypothetical protein AVDCRST_MAG77-867 [uncultured Chloroflexota bacterium]
MKPPAPTGMHLAFRVWASRGQLTEHSTRLHSRRQAIEEAQ